jgi:translation initiation factor IF-3
MTPSQALQIATEKTLDLVEIAAQANPPVCRIMNSGKYFYQMAKRESEARKHQKHIQVKEVKFRTKIDEHDFQFKKRNVERFLAEGNKVKTTVIFRGREMAHSEIGERILVRLAKELTEAATIEAPPKQEGMTMVQVLGPKREVVQKPTKKASAGGSAGRPKPAGGAAAADNSIEKAE